MGVFSYIKNGTKYKMNQFPGAYPASRVSYNGSDVETALDELNADIGTLLEFSVDNISVPANTYKNDIFFTSFMSSKIPSDVKEICVISDSQAVSVFGTGYTNNTWFVTVYNIASSARTVNLSFKVVLKN